MHRELGLIVGVIALFTALHNTTSSVFWWCGQIDVGTNSTISTKVCISTEKIRITPPNDYRYEYDCKDIIREESMPYVAAICENRPNAALLSIFYVFGAAALVSRFVKSDKLAVIPLLIATAASITMVVILIKLSNGFTSAENDTISVKSDEPTAVGVIDGIIVFTILPIAYAGVTVFELANLNSRGFIV